MAAWTDDESDRLRELHADGRSLHSIAKELHRSSQTVHRWAGKLGLSFGDDRTAEAVKVKVLNTRERKAEAADRELELLELEQLRALDVHHGRAGWRTLIRGEGGAERETNLDFIPARDLREHTNARAGMAATIDKLTDHTTDHDDAKAMLVQMRDQLRAAVDTDETEGGAGL